MWQDRKKKKGDRRSKGPRTQGKGNVLLFCKDNPDKEQAADRIQSQDPEQLLTSQPNCICMQGAASLHSPLPTLHPYPSSCQLQMYADACVETNAHDSHDILSEFYVEKFEKGSRPKLSRTLRTPPCPSGGRATSALCRMLQHAGSQMPRVGFGLVFGFFEAICIFGFSQGSWDPGILAGVANYANAQIIRFTLVSITLWPPSSGVAGL